jgi:hypothetical protein
MPKQPRSIYVGQIKTNDCKAATTPDILSLMLDNLFTTLAPKRKKVNFFHLPKNKYLIFCLNEAMFGRVKITETLPRLRTGKQW